MPLHLLGKKSWNVYNTANIERVQRDEAEARAREEAEEQRMQQEDAARRVAILRGDAPPPLPESAKVDEADAAKARRSRDADIDGVPHERKRRRVRGEDDTDRDIRYAREDAEAGDKAKQTLRKSHAEEAPLTDHAGHLQLIPAPDEKTVRRAEKNAEVEAEKAKKRKRDEDQVTMRFSDAAGFKQGMAKPWYSSNKLANVDNSSTSEDVVLSHVQEKDVWGNEDPRRKERERTRMSSSDPFAAMQNAQRQLKQSGRDKERWQKERLAELEELRQADEKRERREKRHRRRHGVEDGLEGFSLDLPAQAQPDRQSHDRHGERRHRHHRSRSRSTERVHHRSCRHRPD